MQDNYTKQHNKDASGYVVNQDNADSQQVDNKSSNQEVQNDDIINNKDNEIAQLNDDLLRAIAENDNTIKRYERQLQEVKEYAIFNFAKDMLSVLDDLSLALSNMEQQLDDSNNQENNKIKNAITGIEMTQKKFGSILSQYGIQKFEPKTGEPFDSNIHHVLSLVKDTKCAKGTVVSVMQVGYRLKDRLLRPAIVSVAE
ncbi:nucleotide exchange factor GrpE [Orientia tsutsugamushi]|uniref:nucleotide exchange factor GrpE n=1 Tax=Orientia tsutsugamushi TaxID=784 RepID=UPI00315D754C